jgi:hypothetical protein
MPQKSKARRGASKTGKAGARKSTASEAKTQSERFIETARILGVDESGKEFERALSKIAPPSKKRRS